MSQSTTEKRVVKRKPPAWIVDDKGHKRQLEKARWNAERVAQIFTDDPTEDFTVDDLARLVYGHNGKRNRENVRKHIPLQRNYMMARLLPIVTRYGARGRITSVKLYDREALEDRRGMHEELDRLRMRREISEDRYRTMCGVLGLDPENFQTT